ncbi:Neo1 protein-like, partial [Scleropages formosus]
MYIRSGGAAGEESSGGAWLIVQGARSQQPRQMSFGRSALKHGGQHGSTAGNLGLVEGGGVSSHNDHLKRFVESVYEVMAQVTMGYSRGAMPAGGAFALELIMDYGGTMRPLSCPPGIFHTIRLVPLSAVITSAGEDMVSSVLSSCGVGVVLGDWYPLDLCLWRHANLEGHHLTAKGGGLGPAARTGQAQTASVPSNRDWVGAEVTDLPDLTDLPYSSRSNLGGRAASLLPHQIFKGRLGSSLWPKMRLQSEAGLRRAGQHHDDLDVMNTPILASTAPPMALLCARAPLRFRAEFPEEKMNLTPPETFRNAVSGLSVTPFTPFWFSVEPVDTVAIRGAPVQLNCSAQSDTGSPPRVEWKKDGTFLNLASDERRQLLADGSLLITSVVHSKHNKPDEGVYQCVASIESLGIIASRTARLSVAEVTVRGFRNSFPAASPWESGRFHGNCRLSSAPGLQGQVE